jgi:hypothetical protein
VNGSIMAALSVLVLFLLGLVAMLAGLVISAFEIRVSHRALDYEVQRVLNLPVSPGRLPTGRPR